VSDYLTRAPILLPLAIAIVFGLVSLALGFGWALSIGSALVGARSGRAFLARSSSQRDSMSRSLLLEALTGGRNPKTQAQRVASSVGFADARKPRRQLLSQLGHLLITGSLYQRVATRLFITQTVAGTVAVPLFWVAQAGGLDVALINSPAFGELFAPVVPTEAIARVKFDNLFLPLILFYGLSLPMLVITFLYSFASTLRNLRKYWRVWLFVPMCVLGSVLMVFYEGTARQSWQNLIFAGNLWGYLIIFVVYPLFLLLVTASLPSQRSR
jgi:hypothetical protein